MEPIVKDFEADIQTVLHQIELLETLRKFASIPQEGAVGESAFDVTAKSLHDTVKNVQLGIPLASGTLLLYTCGRFEIMARTIFEDLCQRLVARAGVFARLPKKMQEALPIFTAKVIAEPRKYGHAENGVRAFVTTLASNLEPGAAVTRVNHECLSLTDSNMRADVLAELFSRIGANNLWPQVAAQAALKTHFEDADAAKVEKAARKQLNDLMDLRNKIAHPSGELEWPSLEALKAHISFLLILARTIGELVKVFELTLCVGGAAEPKDAPAIEA